MPSLGDRMADFRPRVIGHVNLAAAAPLGARRARGLRWDPAEHPRVPGGAHGGQFTRNPASGADLGQSYAAKFSDEIRFRERTARDPGVKQELNLAGAAFDAGDTAQAAEHLRNASDLADKVNDPVAELALRNLADTIESVAGRRDTGEKAALRLATVGAAKVPAMVGGGREIWDGKITVSDDLGSVLGGTVLAQIDWNGHMSVLGNVAEHLAADLSGKDEIKDPASFSVPLHELIHGVTGGREAAQQQAHDRSDRTQLDDSVLAAFWRLDDASADQGVHIHTVAEVLDQLGPSTRARVSQAVIDDLQRRGYLAKSPISTRRGMDGPWEAQWQRTAKAAATDPVQGRQEDDRAAYVSEGGQAIEEGFTELGTIQHAPEFFDAVGIGDRLTPMLAMAGGKGDPDPVLKAEVLAELNRRARDTNDRDWAAAANHLEHDRQYQAQKRLSMLMDRASGREHQAIAELKMRLSEVYDLRTVSNPQWAARRDTLVKLFDAQALKISARQTGPIPASPPAGAVYVTAELEKAQRAMRRASNDLLDGDLQGAMEEVGNLQGLGDPEFGKDAVMLSARLKQLAETPASKHATMSEYARRLQDRDRIVTGAAWGHYPAQTKLALEWVEEAAMAEGLHGEALQARERQLADEINREGAEGKGRVMVAQALRAAGRDPVLVSQAEQQAMYLYLRGHWLRDGSVATFQQMLSDAREMGR